jgi:6-phosphofructokinase
MEKRTVFLLFLHLVLFSILYTFLLKQHPLLAITFVFQKEGTYKGKKFNAVCHFFGYQARGSLPSKFDCDYAYVCLYPYSLLQ